MQRLQTRRTWYIMVYIAAFLAPTGCRAREPSQEDYLAVVPHIVSFAQRNVGGSGPLLLDVHSFSKVGEAVTRASVPMRTVASAVDRPFRSVERTQAVICRTEDDCHVLDDGVHISLDSIQVLRWGVKTYGVVLYTTGGYSRGTTTVCGAPFQISFEHTQHGWRRRSTATIGEC